jgi:hypothetical protein
MTLVLDGTNNTYLSATERGQLMTLSTAQATTSGTSKDFTDIPTWAKKITVVFSGVSTSGTSFWHVRVGPSSGIVSTGYVSGSTTSTTFSSSTAGFIANANVTAAETFSGMLTIINVSGNIWVSSSVLAGGTANNSTQATGTVTLSGTLDRLRITTVNGTDTFDAGSVNILIEGSL